MRVGSFSRRFKLAICLLSLLPVSAAQALTAEAPLSTGGGSSELLTTYEILGVSFSDVLGWGASESGLLFEDLGSDPNGDGIWTDVYIGATIVLEDEFAPEPNAVPSLTRSQQACVNGMNKSGERANKAQLRVNERCLRYFQREKLVEPTFDICTTADETNWVRNAEAKTEEREKKKCDTLDVPPPFAYTDSATVNTAAVDGALWLTYAIFGGPPVLDDNLVTRAENPETAKCQLEMLKRGDKLENTVLKEVNRAKRRALRDETVNSAAALEADLWAVFSSNDRIERTQDRLVRWVDSKCAVLQTPPSTIFPGECGEVEPNTGMSELRQIEVCVIEAARCEACLKINAFDDLNLDCDQADDQDVNGSCPAADGAEVPNHQQPTNSDCFPNSVPDSASTWAQMCIDLARSVPNMPFTPSDYQGMPEDCKALVNPVCR